MTESGTAPSEASQNVHAVAILIGEAGILIRGRPGSGKTRLGLGMIDLARLAGRFACLVADDRVLIRRTGHCLVARAHPAIAGQVEIRGYGIVKTAHEAGAVIRLIIDLTDSATERLPEAGSLRTEIAGVALPHLPLLSCIGPADAMHRAAICLRQDCHF